MALKAEDYDRSSDYDDRDSMRGKPPKKPSRKPSSGQKRKFASKLLTKETYREQRSSSEDSIIKLLQTSPVIYESEDDDAMAISAEAYEKMRKLKLEAETSDSDRELLCFTAEVKTTSRTNMPVSAVDNNLSELDTLLADLSSAHYKAGNQESSQPPARPPAPKTREAPVSPVAARIPRRRPPKLMHVLTKDGRHHDLCKEAREDYSMDLDVDLEMDYDYSYGVSQPASLSNYSTLRTSDAREREDYDYGTLNRSEVPVSEEELEKETGAGPRGDRSRFIETDSGVVQSKYRYMGFGLWENLDPAAPKKPKKKSPPPPPPKAEPIMYSCTVSVSKTVSSKELDDLVTKDLFSKMPRGEVEVGDGVGDLGAGIGEPFEMFEKEDMSDMFRRAMLEKMQLVDDPPAKYKCCVCNKPCQSRVITAMGNKFHPQCFVCTYCRGPFKERKYKTHPRDRKPYCFDCFEKLLGHYGDAHAALG